MQRGVELLGEIAGDKIEGREQRTVIARRGACDDLGQQRAELRRVGERLQRGQDVIERDANAARVARARVDIGDLVPGGSQGRADRRQRRREVGMRGAAGDRGRTGADERGQRRVARRPDVERDAHRRRRDAVEHDAAHALRMAPQVFQRDARSIRAAPQVDPCGNPAPRAWRRDRRPRLPWCTGAHRRRARQARARRRQRFARNRGRAPRGSNPPASALRSRAATTVPCRGGRRGRCRGPFARRSAAPRTDRAARPPVRVRRGGRTADRAWDRACSRGASRRRSRSCARRAPRDFPGPRACRIARRSKASAAGTRTARSCGAPRRFRRRIRQARRARRRGRRAGRRARRFVSSPGMVAEATPCAGRRSVEGLARGEPCRRGYTCRHLILLPGAPARRLP